MDCHHHQLAVQLPICSVHVIKWILHLHQERHLQANSLAIYENSEKCKEIWRWKFLIITTSIMPNYMYMLLEELMICNEKFWLLVLITEMENCLTIHDYQFCNTRYILQKIYETGMHIVLQQKYFKIQMQGLIIIDN